MAWGRASDRAFDLDRIRRRSAALRRREHWAEHLRVIVPVAALALTGYLAIQHMVLQDIPALQAMMDNEVASRCTAMSCTCPEDVAALAGPPSELPRAAELLALNDLCGFTPIE
jgi:hypothetical protein